MHTYPIVQHALCCAGWYLVCGCLSSTTCAVTVCCVMRCGADNQKGTLFNNGCSSCRMHSAVKGHTGHTFLTCAKHSPVLECTYCGCLLSSLCVVMCVIHDGDSIQAAALTGRLCHVKGCAKGCATTLSMLQYSHWSWLRLQVAMPVHHRPDSDRLSLQA